MIFARDAETERPRDAAREKLLNDLRMLVHDSEDLVKATADELGEKTQEARKRVAQAVDQAKQSCNELEDRTWAKAKQKGKEADEYVHHHPYKTMASAFGIGLFLGLLLNRR